MTIESASVADQLDYEVIVVGAGFGGLNALYRFRSHGYRVHVLEGGGGLGGTWYWNRYPGARVDIESMEYSYAFSEELQQEWKWTERYSKQADVLQYLEWVADRLDLRRDITFDSFVQTARFDESTATWQLTTSEGRQYRCRYCVMAVGFLSDTYWPDIPGLQSIWRRASAHQPVAPSRCRSGRPAGRCHRSGRDRGPVGPGAGQGSR